jgi:5-methylcytosine-specific restriction endonuclease McrA
MNASGPPADFQLRFLTEVQRILQEGQFTATYKFALIHSIADLCIQAYDPADGALALSVDALAERFVELYWRQVAPWPGAAESRPLAQNTGRQAAVVREVIEARRRTGGRLDVARNEEEEWAGITRSVSATVRKMPLLRLQRVGADLHEFLYENRVHGRGREAFIRMNPGIAFCFRRFHPLVLDLVRGAWVHFIRKHNTDLLGDRAELTAFLFGFQRAALRLMAAPLLDVQDGQCLYCRKGLRSDTLHVDHFVPWSRYPMELAHNLVASHQRCNLQKSDHLAAEAHLDRWAARNADRAYEIASAGDAAGLRSSLDTSLRVTRWAYSLVAERDGLVWESGRSLIPLEGRWRQIGDSAA